MRIITIMFFVCAVVCHSFTITAIIFSFHIVVCTHFPRHLMMRSSSNGSISSWFQNHKHKYGVLRCASVSIPHQCVICFVLSLFMRAARCMGVCHVCMYVRAMTFITPLKGGGTHVLRRRVVWLLGKWFGKMPKSMHIPGLSRGRCC